MHDPATIAGLIEAARLDQIMFGNDVDNLVGAERASYARDMVLSAVKELTELLDEVNWKPWASPTGEASKEAINELADVLRFCMNLAVLIGADGESLVAAIERKRFRDRKRTA